MSVMGFDDVYNNSQWVRLQTKPNLEIRIASPAGLVIMKLISWKTGEYKRRQKDAYDLNFITKYYSETGNQDRLYSNYPGILEKYEFDNYLAGAYLLGLDISKILKGTSKNRVKS